MQNQLSVNSSELSLLLSKLTESQVITNNALSNVTNRVTVLEEKFDKEMFVTNAQRIAIKKHIKQRLKDFCETAGYNFKTAANVLFKAIYNDINNQFCVTTYNELPRAYYGQIIEIIIAWIPSENILKRINA